MRLFLNQYKPKNVQASFVGKYCGAGNEYKKVAQFFNHNRYCFII